MKLLQKIGMLLLVVVYLLSVSCEAMDENYEQYQEEHSYSGKILELKSFIGYERIILTWDNPKDQKSMKSEVVYSSGNEVKTITYDVLEDSVSIGELKSGSGYDFKVYTLDADGNRSTQVMISALPVSEAFVTSILPPTCMLTKNTETGDIELHWNALSTVVMKFAGEIDYTIKANDGSWEKSEVLLVDLEYDPETQHQRDAKVIQSYTYPIPEIKAGVSYTITYTVKAWPISGVTVTEDIITKSKEVKLSL